VLAFWERGVKGVCKGVQRESDRPWGKKKKDTLERKQTHTAVRIDALSKLLLLLLLLLK
jgi:hypothetical protein